MKAIELREKSSAELHQELERLRHEQFKLRMAQASGQLSRTQAMGQVRKDIARVKTVLTEKQG